MSLLPYLLMKSGYQAPQDRQGRAEHLPFPTQYNMAPSAFQLKAEAPASLAMQPGLRCFADHVAAAAAACSAQPWQAGSAAIPAIMSMPSPNPSRNMTAIAADLIRSAQNRRIARRHACAQLRNSSSAEVAGPSSKSSQPGLHWYTLQCLTSAIPAPSTTMRTPTETLFREPDARFGAWNPADSLACLKMTMVEYRDQVLTPDEQRVATPYELRWAMSGGRLLEMRALWQNKLAAERQQALSEVVAASRSSSLPPSQSVFEEDSDDEDAHGDAVYQRFAKAIDAIRDLSDRASSTGTVIRTSGVAVSPSAGCFVPHDIQAISSQPLKITGRTPPYRPYRPGASPLAGMEKARGCACGPFLDKCALCTPQAVRLAVEEDQI